MKLSLTDDVLEIRLEGFEKFWAAKAKQLEIPLEHIVSVKIGQPAFSWKHLRVGTYLPYVIHAGSYYSKRNNDDSWVWEFWYVTHGKKALTLELKDERYRRVVIGLDDAKYWEELLTK